MGRALLFAGEQAVRETSGTDVWCHTVEATRDAFRRGWNPLRVFAWTQLAFLGRAVLGKGIGEDDDGCGNMKGWMWPKPALPLWEDKGLAVAHPRMLKPHWLSPKRTLLFSYKIQILGGGGVSLFKKYPSSSGLCWPPTCSVVDSGLSGLYSEVQRHQFHFET